MNDWDRAIGALAAARKVVFFTGAGVSAASGIPTFRDKLTGFWEKHAPEKLETARAFRENPQLVWGWYLWRRSQAGQAQPNAAHLSISRLASTGIQVSVITQNIDDLHERAGSQNVVHLHGSLINPICFACKRPAELTTEQLQVSAEGQWVEPPRCTRCNGKLRPGVVWFGEDLPSGSWKAALADVKNCDVLISVGTSGIVRPAADIPEIASTSGATVIHVNIADVCLGAPNELMLMGSAEQVLPALLQATPSS
ncbi:MULTISPECIES: SIR2 family NAD-dependent protein deacylase [Pseudomonas]|uniref:SIR2 family NAD-dependent protein deacylase n=1 Tax=Pseudomonas TaxID=286 RepID=UPI0006146C98|nr:MULTISPECIES: NAD-dependent deacylase [Pseudomonas]